MKKNILHSNPKLYILLILITFICITFIVTLFYIDYQNMINNGYINKNSISFTLDDTNSTIEITKGKDKYILFQQESNKSDIKYVYLSGDVQLPPIFWNTAKNPFDSKEPKAIVGKNAEKEKIPNEYEIVGYFNSDYSYQLNNAIWLISPDEQIDGNKGTYFIFSTPSLEQEKILKRNLETSSFKILERDNVGTYLLKSNQLLITGIQVGIFFLSTFFIVTASYWISQEKPIIRILYLQGTPIYTIYSLFIKKRVLPLFVFSLLMLMILFVSITYLIDMWSNAWLLYSFYFVIGFSLYNCIYLLFITIKYTTGKGGKKY